MKIGIIGAGPRGLSLVERLLTKTRSSNKNIEIDIFDNYPIGGKVWNWQNKHNHKFLMNTPVEQVTLFTDNSVRDVEKITNGPSIYQWITTGQAKDYLKKRNDIDSFYGNHINTLASNSHCVRGLMGVYSEWFFDLQKKQLSDFQKLIYQPYEVTNVIRKENKFIVFFAETQKEYDCVVIAPGHITSKDNDSEKIVKFAKDNGLQYYPADNPADVDFSNIKDGENVFIEGLGLSFYDYLYELATRNGGYFEKISESKLKYHSTDKQIKLYAGSRSSIPMNARAINYKGVFWEYEFKYFKFAKLKEVYSDTNQINLENFLLLIKQELLFNYLKFVISNNKVSATLNDLINCSQNFQTLLNFATKKNIEVPAIINDITDLSKWPYINGHSFSENLKENITLDINNALLGNFDSEYAIIFETLKEIRDVIRDLVELNMLSPEVMHYLNSDFKRMDNRLSVGPPVIRVQQMQALIEEGVLNIIPNFTVKCEEGSFILYDKNLKIVSNYLIEARLGTISIQEANDKLMHNLYKKNILTNAKYSSESFSYETNAVLIDKKTFQVIDKNGEKLDNLFVFGIPTDGYVWFTTSLPRPYANAMILRESERIAKVILETQG